MSPPETAATLRRAGRRPPTPFRIALEDGRMLTLQRLLRMLPGKRLTGEGEIGGKPVLAKLFIARSGGERHWRQERGGLEALAARKISTPRLLAAGRLKDGGHYLLTEFLEGAEAFSLPSPACGRGAGGEGEHERAAAAAVLPELASVFETLGRLHARGLAQDDPHLGNFLRQGATLHVIDGAAIRPGRPGQPLPDAEARKNLALLLAQLPAGLVNEALAALLAAYRTGHPRLAIDAPQLQREIAAARDWRLRDYLAKCLRDCSLFKVEKRHGRFVSVVRGEAEFLAPVIADPDRWLDGGIRLKSGGTCTLALVEHGGRKLVIKRYNIKGAGHALSRFWRPSRAWHSWVEGHRLGFLGIATPRPLALIERRIGPLRGRAWLITEYCGGPDLAAHLAPFADTEVPQAERAAIRQLFAGLAGARISHGDLKASNLIWRGDHISVLDLDAMRQHGRAAAYARAWRKDRARFLRNWPAASALHRWLDDTLPKP